MSRRMAGSTDSDTFDRLVADPARDFRLSQAGLLVAADHCPDVKPGYWLSRLDALGRRVGQLGGRTASDQIAALRTVLVDEYGFRGNRHDYHDPRNSLMHEVVQRRLGIPISLSVIWLDVTEQLDWPFLGLGVPGHFVIARRVPGDEVILDPFHGGRELSRADCSAIASRLTGGAVSAVDECFRPASKRAMLARLLANLCSIHQVRGDWGATWLVLRRLMALEPNSPAVRRHVELVALKLAERN